LPSPALLLKLAGNIVDGTYFFPCQSEVCASIGKGDMIELRAASIIGSPTSFILQKGDNDWRFIFVSADLETDRVARKMRIENPKINYDAHAETWMITGECITMDGQENASRSEVPGSEPSNAIH
jgi:hypothetical protein